MQLTASNQIDVNETFDLIPNDRESGNRYALLIGINYIGHSVGQLSGCHNDAQNMVEYVKDVHGFPEENITILLDKDGYTQPTRENMLEAYKELVAKAEPGDCLFCHYSGHVR